MNFLVDAQLPPALARWLTEEGYPSKHVNDLSMAQSRDQEIWAEAKRNNWVIITKDEDFVVLSGIDPSGSPVVWLRVGNCRRQCLLNWFGALFPSILDELAKGERLVEVI